MFGSQVVEKIPPHCMMLDRMQLHPVVGLFVTEAVINAQLQPLGWHHHKPDPIAGTSTE
jgi:hypothetical protein